MFVCLRVCLSVCLYRNPNRWTDQDEIWHGGGPQGGKVLGVLGCVKGVRRYRSLSHSFWRLKQKLQGAPDLVGAGDLFGEFKKSMLKCLSLIAIWSGLRLPKLTPGVQGAQKGGSWASAMRFGWNFIKQKLLGTQNLVGVSHLIGPNSGSGRTWARCASGAVVLHFHREFITWKLWCMFQIGLLPIGHDHRDRALGWRGPQGPGRPMSGYLNMPES